ncbi:hypothetical protein D1BOALGB6SA_4146 [Olavius sp. associated proteobacterium Delta 1]|nr:hypothetical protein D1BOALGB6SA_4146 [Olavius sp. associated proteobacterium Delta 1]
MDSNRVIFLTGSTGSTGFFLGVRKLKKPNDPVNPVYFKF